MAGLTVGGCSEADDPFPVSGELTLTAFRSCDQALEGLTSAARRYISPWGLTRPGDFVAGAVEDAAGAAEVGGADRAPAAAEVLPDQRTDGDYSTTNVHESGVDEPDLIKTDGERVFALVGGRLHIVDVASRHRTTLDLSTESWGGQLLLSEDRVLVILPDAPPVPPASSTLPTDIPAIATRLVLVEIAGPDGSPRIISDLTLDGEYLDARQVGDQVRLVTRSGPRLPWRYPEVDVSETEALLANQILLANSTIEDWLPRYRLETAGTVEEGLIPCDRVSHPANYTGSSMLTVLSVDLTRELSLENTVTITADGNVVYGTAESLYIANDLRYAATALEDASASTALHTELYKFDTTGSGAPRYVAAGTVPGWLLNQYALSEYDGHLRVATTVATDPSNPTGTESGVYVLRQSGDDLVTVGSVGGLGRTEQIYAVRFLGPTGYVVTFRQTDPLYTIDLRDPTAPQLVGELHITGYSSYLHPVADDRLLGVGQEATTEGMTLGTQISLFDVSDPAAPERITAHHLEGAWSEAEFDPHAFLYWPDTGLLVIPVTIWETTAEPAGPDTPVDSRGMLSTLGGGALVMRLSGDSLTEIGMVPHHPDPAGAGMIRRTVLIDNTLWTLSDVGLRVSDGTTLEEQAWIPFA